MDDETRAILAENKHLHGLLRLYDPYISDDVLERCERRHQGTADLHRLLAESSTERPRYALIKDFFAPSEADKFAYAGSSLISATVYDEKTRKRVPREIDWDGIPNDGMTPVNDRAKAIFEAWERSVTPWGQRAIKFDERSGTRLVLPRNRRWRLWQLPLIARLKRVYGGWRQRAWLKGACAAMYDHPRSVARRKYGNANLARPLEK